MPSCVIKGCTNYDAKLDKQKDCISFHRFPADPVRKEAWSRIIRRQRAQPYFKTNEYLRICSAHFKEEDFYLTKSGLRRLKDTAIPKCEPLPHANAKSSSESDSEDGDYSNEPQIKIISVESRSKVTSAAEPDRRVTSAKSNLEEDIESANVHSENILSELEVLELEPAIDSSDLESIFDSPEKYKLRKDLRRMRALQMKHIKMIKALQLRNRRLIKRNASLKQIVKTLKRRLSN